MSDKPFVEPVVLLRGPFKPDPELAKEIKKEVDLGFMEQGLSIPLVNQTLYSDSVRGNLQTKIYCYYASCLKVENSKNHQTYYKLRSMDCFQLKKRFVFLETKLISSGIDYEHLLSGLNTDFGALTLRERICVYGLDAKDFKNKNYRLVQEPQDLNFSVYVRFELPKKT